MAARALFNLFLLGERIFALVFFMPAISKTVRTLPPATKPRPLDDGFTKILALPCFPRVSNGIEPFSFKKILIRFFFAFLKAFSIADDVSSALPMPTPTSPFLLPITNDTRKLNRLPPATTLATLRISIIFCSYSGGFLSGLGPNFSLFLSGP